MQFVDCAVGDRRHPCGLWCNLHRVHEGPITALGNDRQLLDLDVDELAPTLSLVTAEGCARRGTPIEPADGLCSQVACTVEGARPSWWATLATPKLAGPEIEYLSGLRRGSGLGP